MHKAFGREKNIIRPNTTSFSSVFGTRGSFSEGKAHHTQSHVEIVRGVRSSAAKMSNQCKNCDRDRDMNNNLIGYPSGYMTSTVNNNNNRNNTTTTSATTTNSATQIKAKIMFGSVGAIKELREKEHAEKARSTQAGRRQ